MLSCDQGVGGLLYPKNVEVLAAIFNRLDQNRNGKIDDGDFNIFVNQPGVNPRKVREAMAVWLQIKATCDGNADGVITKSEFLNGMVIHALGPS